MTGILRRLGSRDRRTLVIGTIVCGVVLLGGRGMPWLHRTTRELAVREERATLTIERATRLRSTAVGSGWSPADDARWRTELAFQGPTPTAAAATAAAHLSNLTRVLGGTLLSASPEADSGFRSGVARIVVHLQLSFDGIALRAFVSELEHGSKALRVQSLSVTQPAPIATPNDAEALRVELTIEGIAVEREVAAR